MYSSNNKQKNQPNPKLGSGRTQKQQQPNPAFVKKKKGGGAKAPKQQQQNRGNTNKPKQLHTLSPHNGALVPTVLRSGEAFPYRGMVRNNLTHAVGDVTIVAITNTGGSGSVMGVLTVSGGVVSRFVFTIPTLAASDDAGGPTSGRAMKAGVSLVNTTQLLNRGGRIFTLHANQRIRLTAAPSAFTVADHTALDQTIKAFPSTREHDGAEFGRPSELSTTVVDHPAYETFSEWRGTDTIDEFFSTFAIWPGSIPDSRPMSTVLISFQPPAVTQTYTITARATFYTRWPLDTIVGQAQTPIPTAPASLINSMHTVADRVATKGLHFAEDVAMSVGAAAIVAA
jgi:hypothetical protein